MADFRDSDSDSVQRFGPVHRVEPIEFSADGGLTWENGMLTSFAAPGKTLGPPISARMDEAEIANLLVRPRSPVGIIRGGDDY